MKINNYSLQHADYIAPACEIVALGSDNPLLSGSIFGDPGQAGPVIGSGDIQNYEEDF